MHAILAGAFLVLTRATISAASASSQPDGYVLNSGVAVEGAMAWGFHPYFGFELDLRTESREADFTPPGAAQTPLGSLELLPLYAFLQFRPQTGAVRPYLGAGLNCTITWEKTGAFDDTRVSPRFGPAAQIGLDIELGERVLLNLDARYNVFRPEVIRNGARVAAFTVDPLTLGAGLGVRL